MLQVHTGLAAAALALLPAPAWAAEAADHWATLGALWASAATLALVIALLFARREARAVLAAKSAAATEAARWQRVIGAATPFIGWTKEGETCAPHLAEHLGLAKPVATFGDLEAAFEPGDFRYLMEAVEGLRRDGRPFALALVSRDNNRLIEARGGRTSAAAAVAFRDITAEQAAATENAAKVSELGRQRDRYLALLDAMPFPIWSRDRDLKLDWCNQAYSRMVEAEPARVLNDGIELASGLEQPLKLAAKARDNGTIASETRRIVVAGDRRAFRIVERPLGDAALAGFGQDITSEDEARAELARHIDAHAEVLQNLSTAIGIFGPDKRLILFNRAYARLWDLDETWLGEKPHFAEVLEELRENRRLPEQIDWQSYKRQRMELFTTVIEPKEELMHLPDERTLRVVITPHPFGGLLFTHEDVTDQLALERSRNTLIAVQRATLDNLYEGVAVYGSDGRLKLYNRALSELWGMTDTQLSGEPHLNEVTDAWRNLLEDGDNWRAFKDELVELVMERQAGASRIDRPDGSVIDFASVPLPDGAMLLTYLDVTDSANIERALRERNDALQAADRLKSQFVANVSYELRTPLNTIIGFAELLHEQYYGDLNDRQREYLQNILKSSTQLLLLINDILDLAVIEGGQMVLQPENFDLHGMLETALGLVRERARQEKIQLEFDCPADIGWLTADEKRIRQVLFNLMSNSIKFTPPGGSITLGARREGDGFGIWVKDTGIGIPEADQERVFAKFQKSRSGGRQSGVGLGLALVRSFIELHGGRIELQSAPDQGTCVKFHLPAQATEPAAA